MENRKRKPLADVTNTHNIIPISILRKLVASSTNSNSISKPSVHSNSSSTEHDLNCPESINRSDVSIGSSNTGASRCSRTVQFRTPAKAGDVGNRDTSNRGRQNVDRTNKETAVGSGNVSHAATEKRKDKGKAISVPLDSPQRKEKNDIEQAIWNSLHMPEKAKQKDKVMLSLFGGPSKKAEEFGNGTLNPASYSFQKTKTEKNTFPSSSGCSTSKTQEIEKDIGKYSSCSLDKTNDKRKVISRSSVSSIQRSSEIGKNILNSSRVLVDRNSEKGKALNYIGSSHGKVREKGKAIVEPADPFEVAKNVGVGVSITPPKSKSETSKTYGGASRRSATLRTKGKRFDLDEAGNTKFPKSWTDPLPKIRKKRCSRVESPSILPLDFIQKQKAYFDEIDAFKLEVEEVSEDDVE